LQIRFLAAYTIDMLESSFWKRHPFSAYFFVRVYARRRVMVRLDRAVPVARCVGSRSPCASAPAQCPAAQIASGVDPKPSKPSSVCRGSELNPKENLWDEIREKIFKNYALKSIDAVRAKLKQAILYIERNPKLVRSITSFPYILNSL
jgi:hypothetical protein